MLQIHYGLFYIVFMIVLLGCSAFFSGSETALFSLSRNSIKTMRQSKHRLEHIVVKLLQKPEQLLGSLLLGNLIVNILFFATASVLSVKLEQQVNTTVAATVAFASFIMLILCGEILPKYLSYNNSKRISIVAALPVFLVVRFFSPVVTFFRSTFVEPALTIFLGTSEQPKPISPNEFKALIETTRQRGLISLHQDKILTELMDFGFLKVRNVLQPRVDIITCSAKDTAQKAGEIMSKNHLTKIPIYSNTIDDIIGIVHLRDILLHPESNLNEITKEVEFVPEQKSVESILEFFRKGHTDTAVVVDEYGGVAGLVCLEDIAEELFGSITKEKIDMIEQLSPFEYRLAGYLPIHDWIKRFGLKPKEIHIATVGGFVASLLGKIPQKGDVAHWENLTFTVERVSKHRIRTVLLTIKPETQNNG
jgi:putative hemolysin